MNIPQEILDDLDKFHCPLYKGSMSYCYLDGYFAHAFEEKHNMTIEEATKKYSYPVAERRAFHANPA